MRKLKLKGLGLFAAAILTVTTGFSTSAFASSSVNLAEGKTVTASSYEGATVDPSKAVDGNTATRWSSNFSDDQWIAVDLGASYAIDEVKLNWEAAYASVYNIDVSDDGTNWRNIYTKYDGQGGIEDLTVLGTGRYVRVQGVQRATSYGISLYEFEVYGTPGTNIGANKPTTASSTLLWTSVPSYAVDQNSNTSWSPATTDSNPTITVDLGSTRTIAGANIKWGYGYAPHYKISVSNDGVNWTSVAEVTNNSGGIDFNSFSASGRYVQLYAFDRTPDYFIVHELQVIGS
ncbi:coagulation factor 5/8 type domain protein [Paenibacillus curdlanolyticus YK9]|uniref:Coagulation factor 5/8 type domain protein n=1 Tax=Paenibacillus curdlanolyticus YK9 TaxID=717606 RepID=E0IA95_9BACL|nr:discoidin domain-containing protein [Paenibacillus curdlanolyticus]EFM10672.1 coagulation factor 5/8 type domain protein [Paenibacillus curdlanolyticus YK9]